MKVLLSVILLVMAVSRSHCVFFNEHNMTSFIIRGQRSTLGTFKELLKITDEIKEEIKSIHNTLRQLVASGNEKRGVKGRGPPRAQNMLKMVWDDGVSALASGLAKTCNFVHDIHYHEGVSLGQNLAMSMTNESLSVDEYVKRSMKQLMMSWYDEIDKWDYEEGVCSGSGHLTQMIWADSWKVGCGIALCDPGSGSALFIVCDYKPAGNIYGEKAYVSGPQNCSAYRVRPPYQHTPDLCEISVDSRSCSSIFSQPTSINSLIIYAISLYLYWL